MEKNYNFNILINNFGLTTMLKFPPARGIIQIFLSAHESNPGPLRARPARRHLITRRQPARKFIVCNRDTMTRSCLAGTNHRIQICCYDKNLCI